SRTGMPRSWSIESATVLSSRLSIPGRRTRRKSLRNRTQAPSAARFSAGLVFCDPYRSKGGDSVMPNRQDNEQTPFEGQQKPGGGGNPGGNPGQKPGGGGNPGQKPGGGGNPGGNPGQKPGGGGNPGGNPGQKPGGGGNPG